MKKYINTPTVLTLIRLVVAPLVLPTLLVYFLPYNSLVINGALATLFFLFGITDVLDGYIARKRNQVSRLGGALDHIADKFLIFSSLIGLLAAGKIHFFWVILFIGRDFFVMGLRLIALENAFTVPVDYIGKVKTVFQMLLITWLILNPYQQLIDQKSMWHTIELGLLSVAIVLTVLSAYQYYRSFKRQFMRSQQVRIAEQEH